MAEFDTMELAELRLQLREVDTLLRNLESAGDGDIKPKAASTDSGNAVVNGAASKEEGSSSGLPSTGSGDAPGTGSNGRASTLRGDGPKAVGEEVDVGDKAGLSAKAGGDVDGGSPSEKGRIR